MKKVIKGAVCDTDTAEEIGEARCQGFIECLYRTKSGKYFIHGIGDENSRYSSRGEDGSWIPGEDIVLLTNSAAADWIMDHHGPVDSYYRAKKGAKKEWATIRITAAAKEQIDELTEGKGMTISELISDALEAYRRERAEG